MSESKTWVKTLRTMRVCKICDAHSYYIRSSSRHLKTHTCHADQIGLQDIHKTQQSTWGVCKRNMGPILGIHKFWAKHFKWASGKPTGVKTCQPLCLFLINTPTTKIWCTEVRTSVQGWFRSLMNTKAGSWTSMKKKVFQRQLSLCQQTPAVAWTEEYSRDSGSW